MARTAGSILNVAVAAVFGLGITAVAAAAPTAAAGDNLGKRLVRKYCSTCHEVEPNPTARRRGADGAPGFAALATDPVKGDPRHLKALLGGPHSEMPPHRFSDAEVQAIIAYIRSLGADSGARSTGGTR